MLNELIAFIASAIGVCGTLPQLFRLLRTKDTKAISYLAYTMLAVSSVLWVSYGFVANVYSIMFWNTLSFTFALAVLLVKAKNESPLLFLKLSMTIRAAMRYLEERAAQGRALMPRLHQ